MYSLVLIALLAAGVTLALQGIARRRPSRLILGGAIVVLTILFFALLGFWGEMLWS